MTLRQSPARDDEAALRAAAVAPGEPLLQVRDLRVEYLTGRGPVRAVDGVSFEIRKGEVLGLAGESGCGKSTIANAVTRLLKPPARIAGGEVRFAGQDVLAMDPETLRRFRWSRVSIVFQSAMNALNPDLIIMDEPTTALDVVVQKEIMQQTQAVMEVRGLTKRFAVGGGGLLRRGERRYVHAVDDVSFTLEKGRILALVGESGSGKSTIARMLARLYPPTAGQVRLKGRDALSHQNRRAVLRYRNDVQMIFQDPFGSLNPVKTVGHHLARPLAIHKGLKGRAGDEVAQLYYRDVAASVARPDRMLIGFARLFLAPGEAKQITFTVHPSRLAFYDPRMRFVTEPGEFVFSVGASSADIRCEQAVVLTGAVAPYRQRDSIATRTVIA